jgi:hypothetical protein
MKKKKKKKKRRLLSASLDLKLIFSEVCPVAVKLFMCVLMMMMMMPPTIIIIIIMTTKIKFLTLGFEIRNAHSLSFCEVQA